MSDTIAGRVMTLIIIYVHGIIAGVAICYLWMAIR